MRSVKQKFRPRFGVGAQCVAVLYVCAISVPTPISAREMECSYDYVTHVTTIKINDTDAADRTLFYSFNHSISPTGGEEMYIFSERDPVELRGTGQMKFIMENLYFDPVGAISAIEFIDFSIPTLKQLQAPAAYIKQSGDIISAPLVVWSCQRTD